MIKKFVAPDLGFGFAWSPENRSVYIIHGDSVTHEQIAADVMSPELAEMLVNVWCRGYRSRKREEERKGKHYHMFAESGKVGAKI